MNKNNKNTSEASDLAIHNGLETVVSEMDKLVEVLEDNLKVLTTKPTSSSNKNQEESEKRNSTTKQTSNNSTNSNKHGKNSKLNVATRKLSVSSNKGSNTSKSSFRQVPSNNKQNLKSSLSNSSSQRVPKSAPATKRITAVVKRPSSASSGLQPQNSQTFRNNRLKQKINNIISSKASSSTTIYNQKKVIPRSTTTNAISPLSRTSSASSNKSTKDPVIKNSNVASYKRSNEVDILNELKERVERAIRERKTFTVCGNYYTIRKSLLARGWVEKIRLSYNITDKNNMRALEAKTINELLPMLNTKQNQAVKTMIMSKLLGKHQVDLYWDQNYDAYKINSDNIKFTLINSIKRGMLNYASKQGLCESMKRAHWFQKPGISYIRHPRCYSLTNNGDPDQFIKDFKLTAAMSLIKWIIITHESNNSKLISSTGKVPISIFHFAVNECTKFIQKCKHEDIDNNLEEALDFQWNEFLEYYYKIVHIGNHFKSTHLENEETLVHKSKLLLKKLKKYWPYLTMDGIMNIWILKPINGSRGVGIHICRTLQYVLKVITENKNSRYVIQKYIERPLLIFNTKFDIRQWFLISSTTPLTIWIYKQCYLRFSSQTYNLRKLHESIHLTNNSVQARYKNCNRDPGLPEYNMWDSVEFQRYLENIGYPTIYKTTIYPGMKQCIVAAVLLNQEYIAVRKNSFELYGADFMITEDFKPWLIEINSKPALYPSTPITARMCPSVLEDVIKVVVDYGRNLNAKTGNFELLYKQKIPPLPQCDEASLKLEGKPLKADYFYTPEREISSEINKDSSEIINVNNTNHYMSYIRKEMKKTLEKLLSIIRTERQRRKKLQNVEVSKESTQEKQKQLKQSAKNLDKGVECVLEMKEIFKNNEKPTVEIKNSSMQAGGILKQVKSVSSATNEELKGESEDIKKTLLKLTESSDNNSILLEVLKLLRLK